MRDLSELRFGKLYRYIGTMGVISQGPGLRSAFSTKPVGRVYHGDTVCIVAVIDDNECVSYHLVTSKVAGWMTYFLIDSISDFDMIE